MNTTNEKRLELKKEEAIRRRKSVVKYLDSIALCAIGIRKMFEDDESFDVDEDTFVDIKKLENELDDVYEYLDGLSSLLG